VWAVCGGSRVDVVILFLAVVLEDDASIGVVDRTPVIDVSVWSSIVSGVVQARVIICIQCCVVQAV